MSVRGFTADDQRYMDGAQAGPADAGAAGPDRAAADRLLRAAAAYRDALPALDASLDAVVMSAVRARRRHAATRLWRWPLEGRVRPVWVPLAAVAAALLVWVAVPRRPAPLAAPAIVAVRAADTVYVQFQLAAPLARTVAVAGSFNGWNPKALPMTRRAGGDWVATIALPVGEHSYQFVVNGRRWQPDPTAHAQVDDGFGGTNSVIVVGPKGLVRT